MNKTNITVRSKLNKMCNRSSILETSGLKKDHGELFVTHLSRPAVILPHINPIPKPDCFAL